MECSRIKNKWMGFYRWRVYLIPLLVGVGFACLHVDKGLILENQNEVGGKYSDDALQHVVGLNYFVQDAWRFPLLDVPALGFMENGSNVIYTDSLPLLALPAKALWRENSVLPDYFGSWLFLCFVLQPLAFCWLLQRVMPLTAWTALCGSILSLCMPALLVRWPHINLCSHFLILLSIGAYLDGRRNPHRGTVILGMLTVAGLFVHAYIAAMTLGFLAVHLAQGWQDGRIGLRRCVIEGLGIAVGLLILAVCLGYWSMGRESEVASGYGYFSMNLLAPFWPQASGLLPWLPPAPDATGGQYEGMNYLGAGLLIGLMLVLIFRLSAIRTRIWRHPWLAAYMIFLGGFALSNVIFIGDKQLLELPNPFDTLFSQFRSSGRMFWPVSYIVAALVVIELARSTGGRRWALPALVLLQVVDILPYVGAPTGAPRFYGTWVAESEDALDVWADLIGKHDRLYLLPGYFGLPKEDLPASQVLQYLASQQNIPVSSAYVGRRFTEVPSMDVDARVLQGPVDRSALYVAIPPTVGEADLFSLMGGGVRHLHGLLFASSKTDDGSNGSEGPVLPGERIDLPLLVPDRRYHMGDLAMLGSHLFGGVGPGPDYIWTDSRRAGVIGCLPDAEEGAFWHFRLSAVTFMPPTVSHRVLGFRVNGTPVGSRRLSATEADLSEHSVLIPVGIVPADRIIRLEWGFEDTLSPRMAGLSEDPRYLGFGLQGFTVSLMHPPRKPYMRSLSIGEDPLPLEVLHLHGFSAAEGWGRWTDGEVAEVGMVVDPTARQISITLEAEAFLTEAKPGQTAVLSINGQERMRVAFTPEDRIQVVELEVNADDIPEDGTLLLQMTIGDPRSPEAMGLSSDARRLGLAVRRLELDVR